MEGATGEMHTAENVIDGAQDKTEVPTECCWIQWRGEKTERKAHGQSGEGTDYLTYKL